MSTALTPSKTAAALIHALLIEKEYGMDCPTTGEYVSIAKPTDFPPELRIQLEITDAYVRHFFWMGFYYVLCRRRDTHETVVYIFNSVFMKVASAFQSSKIYKVVQ